MTCHWIPDTRQATNGAGTINPFWVRPPPASLCGFCCSIYTIVAYCVVFCRSMSFFFWSVYCLYSSIYSLWLHHWYPQTFLTSFILFHVHICFVYSCFVDAQSDLSHVSHLLQYTDMSWHARGRSVETSFNLHASHRTSRIFYMINSDYDSFSQWNCS